MCCSLIASKSVEKLLIKYDLLFFVGSKDKSGKAKILTLESAKTFCGSGPQLCYQLWLLHATTYLKSYQFYHEYREASLTQYLSIISSFMLMTKSAFELLSYQRIEDPLDDENKGSKEKIMEVLRIFFSYLSWLPLILTSLLYKVFSINLYMRFFGWASFGMFIGIFLLNILCSLAVPAITNSRMKLKYPKNKKNSRGIRQITAGEDLPELRQPVCNHQTSWHVQLHLHECGDPDTAGPVPRQHHLHPRVSLLQRWHCRYPFFHTLRLPDHQDWPGSSDPRPHARQHYFVLH